MFFEGKENKFYSHQQQLYSTKSGQVLRNSGVLETNDDLQTRNFQAENFDEGILTVYPDSRRSGCTTPVIGGSASNEKSKFIDHRDQLPSPSADVPITSSSSGVGDRTRSYTNNSRTSSIGEARSDSMAWPSLCVHDFPGSMRFSVFFMQIFTFLHVIN